MDLFETSLLLTGILLVALGAIAGFLAGLLGIGGGAVLVPGLYYLFSHAGFAEVAMHSAVGTSLLTIILTGTASARAHAAQGAVDLKLVKQFVPGIFIGQLFYELSPLVLLAPQLVQNSLIAYQ